MYNFGICKTTENKRDFMPLLLLGDENESHTRAYLKRGDLFAFYGGDLKSVCVVTDEGDAYLKFKILRLTCVTKGKAMPRN